MVVTEPTHATRNGSTGILTEISYVDPEKVSPHLRCPICADVFREPVSAFSLCQCVFCHQCILTWLQSRSECPMDRKQPMSAWGLQPNRLVQSLIDDLEVYCRFQNEGCQWHGRLHAQTAHEENCLARKAWILSAELEVAQAENADLHKAKRLLADKLFEKDRQVEQFEFERKELRQLQSWLALAPPVAGLMLAPGRADPLSGSSAEWLQAADPADSSASSSSSRCCVGLVERVLDEGRRVGLGMDRTADNRPVSFFCCGVHEPAGDLDMLKMSLRAMNDLASMQSSKASVASMVGMARFDWEAAAACMVGMASFDGGSSEAEGRLRSMWPPGKMIFSVGKEQLALAAYIPLERSRELSCHEWVSAVCSEVGGFIVEECGDVITARVPMDAERGVCPRKVINTCIQSALHLLVLLREETYLAAGNATNGVWDCMEPTWLLREENRCGIEGDRSPVGGHENCPDGEHDSRDRRNKIKLN